MKRTFRLRYFTSIEVMTARIRKLEESMTATQIMVARARAEAFMASHRILELVPPPPLEAVRCYLEALENLTDGDEGPPPPFDYESRDYRIQGGHE